MFKQKTEKQTRYGLPEMIFFVGALLALMGGMNLYSTRSGKIVSSSVATSPSVIERKLSIEDAIRNERKAYQYDSNFIPGIGTISDPEAYLKDLEDKAKQNQ